MNNNRQDVLDRWDYKLNNCKSSEINYGTNKSYYFICDKQLGHHSELKNIKGFTGGQEGSIHCNQCNSFAQYLINLYGINALALYWDYLKNTVSPWNISYACNKKVWIKCQEKDYHSYDILCHSFATGNRCLYCAGKKVHINDSLGTLYPKSLKLWSNKNKKSPYEYTPKSQQYVWWRCPEDKHQDYYRSINSSNNRDFRCPECQCSKGEIEVGKILLKKELDYFPQKTFDGLLGLGNGLLSYDFYLYKYNLLIEYQGEMHERFVKGIHKSKKDFEKQQEHDRRKKEYAEQHSIKLLEIWYWDFDNIKKILDKWFEIQEAI